MVCFIVTISPAAKCGVESFKAPQYDISYPKQYIEKITVCNGNNSIQHVSILLIKLVSHYILLIIYPKYTCIMSSELKLSKLHGNPGKFHNHLYS